MAESPSGANQTLEEKAIRLRPKTLVTIAIVSFAAAAWAVNIQFGMSDLQRTQADLKETQADVRNDIKDVKRLVSDLLYRDRFDNSNQPRSAGSGQNKGGIP